MFRQNIGGDKHAIFEPALGDNALALTEQACNALHTDFDLSTAVSDGENVESVDGDAPFFTSPPSRCARCCPVDLGRGMKKTMLSRSAPSTSINATTSRHAIAAMESLSCFGVMGAELLGGRA